MSKNFFDGFQAESYFEISPCAAPVALSHILEFEDGSEVYDTAAYGLAQVHPDIVVNFTRESLNTSQA